MHSSIVTKRNAAEILEVAKLEKEESNIVFPKLFFVTEAGKRYCTPLTELPETAKERRLYLAAFGKHRSDIWEALFIFESWYLKVDEAVDALRVAPSEHPLRLEAIFLVGRNRTKKCHLSVLQPFREENNRIVWLEPDFSSTASVGLLDYLFAPD